MSSGAADQQAQLLIHGYLDDQLNTEQLLQLQSLLQQSPQLADQFAQQHLLHDRRSTLPGKRAFFRHHLPQARAINEVGDQVDTALVFPEI